MFAPHHMRPSFTPMLNNRQYQKSACFNMYIFGKWTGWQKILVWMAAEVPGVIGERDSVPHYSYQQHSWECCYKTFKNEDLSLIGYDAVLLNSYRRFSVPWCLNLHSWRRPASLFLGLPLLAVILNHYVGEVAGCGVDRFPVFLSSPFCPDRLRLKPSKRMGTTLTCVLSFLFLLSVADRKPKQAIHLPVVPMFRICGAFIFMPLYGV